MRIHFYPFVRTISLLTGCLVSGLLTAQDMTRVRATIDTLCSPAMHGRGYVNQGERKAADFLARHFREAGLQAIGDSYFQSFTLNINTFPGRADLKLDKKRLVPGRDFLVNAISSKGKGRGKVALLDTLIFSDENARKAFLQRDIRSGVMVYHHRDYARLVELPLEFLTKLHEAKALIELQDNNKLTHTVSTSQLAHPLFEMKAQDLATLPRKVRFRVDARMVSGYPTQNVIGMVKGTARSDSFLVVTAHYDHLGRMGKQTYFPGANDNASGVSMLLELARYFAAHPQRYSIVFMAFGAEEAGLIGSKYFVDHPLFPLRQIRFLMNLDLLGTGDDGLMVENGIGMAPEFALMEKINARENYFPKLSKRANAPNSDHYFFTAKGVRGVFFYTLGGIKAYHDIDDRAQTLPLTRYREVFGLLRQTLEGLGQ